MCLPCEVEALSIIAAAKHFSQFIIQSKYRAGIVPSLTANLASRLSTNFAEINFRQAHMLFPFWSLSAGTKWTFSTSQWQFAFDFVRTLLTVMKPTWKSALSSAKLKNQWFPVCLTKISWKVAGIYHGSAFKMSALTYGTSVPTWNKSPTPLKKHRQQICELIS